MLSRLVERGIAVPFWPHMQAGYPDAGVRTAGTASNAEAQQRRTGLMIHGGLGRFDFGVRTRMEKILRILNQQGLPVDLRVGEFTCENGTELERLGGDRNTAYATSGRAYLNASLCISPAGNTLTSRRLFDAMSAGCVQVLLRSAFVIGQHNNVSKGTFYSVLPFPLSIDWRSVTLRLLPNRNQACISGDAAWLCAWHGEEAALAAMRERVLDMLPSASGLLAQSARGGQRPAQGNRSACWSSHEEGRCHSIIIALLVQSPPGASSV